MWLLCLFCLLSRDKPLYKALFIADYINKIFFVISAFQYDLFIKILIS